MSKAAPATAAKLAGGLLRYREVLKHRNFALLWVGQTVSWFGDSLYFVSLLWLVQELTGSTALMGVVAACRTIPLLFGVFAGVAVDRLDRRRIMMATDLFRAAVVVLVPLLMAGQMLQFWHIAAVALLLSAAGVFFQPSQQSILPALVAREELPQANSLLTMSQQFANVFGYGLAGLLIAKINIASLFVIDSGTFLVSVLAVAAMRLTAMEANPFLARQQQAQQVAGAGATAAGAPVTARGGSTAARWLGDLGEGLRFIRSQPAMLAIVPLMMLLNFLLAPYMVLLAAWVKDVMLAGPQEYGLLQTAIAVGMICGSLYVGLAAPRLRRSTLALSAIGAFGLGGVVFAASRVVPVSIAVLAVMGCANAAANIIIVTWTQTVVPRAMMGRVFGTLGTLYNAVSPVGQTVAGFVGRAVELPLVFGSVGVIYMLLALMYATVPRLRGAFDVVGLGSAAPAASGGAGQAVGRAAGQVVAETAAAAESAAGKAPPA